MRQYAYFNELPVSTEFFHCGNICKKRSTQTADIDTDNYQGLWFYFTDRDLCEVGPYSRLDHSYFEGPLS